LNSQALKNNGCSVSRGARLRKYGITIQLIGGLYAVRPINRRLCYR
jgi:hypothetical protein